MDRDYPQLWQGVTASFNEGNATQAALGLSEIVADANGRRFIETLESQDEVTSCIEILDFVSCDLHLPPLCSLRRSFRLWIQRISQMTKGFRRSSR